MEDRVSCFTNGMFAFQTGKYDRAIHWFEEGLKYPFPGLGNMSDALMLNNIATAYNKLKDYKNAIIFYNKAIESGLKNEDIYFSLAASYHRENLNDEALKIYDLLLNKNEGNSKAYYLKGKLLKFVGKHELGDLNIEKAKSLGYDLFY